MLFLYSQDIRINTETNSFSRKNRSSILNWWNYLTSSSQAKLFCVLNQISIFLHTYTMAVMKLRNVNVCEGSANFGTNLKVPADIWVFSNRSKFIVILVWSTFVFTLKFFREITTSIRWLLSFNDFFHFHESIGNFLHLIVLINCDLWRQFAWKCIK